MLDQLSRLCEDIFNGRYRKLLKSLKRFRTDIFIWGKKEETISIDSYINEYFGTPTHLEDVSGHAYMINRSVAFELINRQSPIGRAVDVLIEENRYEQRVESSLQKLYEATR